MTQPARVDLYWLPLGAGGWFVRVNGRVYESVRAVIDRREQRPLFHTALIVTVPAGRFVIENAWPMPKTDPKARGSVREGPVADARLGRLRAFRYEIRRWKNGTIADLDEAIESPQTVASDFARSNKVLQLVDKVPALTWGRDELGVGDMWNSNSVVSWLLERAGVEVEAVRAPRGGGAPGWNAGIYAARRGITFGTSHGSGGDGSFE